MIKPLKYVSEIAPYVPGKPIKELEREYGIKDSIKLASNENPLGASQKSIDALKEYLKYSCEIHRYPEGSGYYLKDALVKKISQHEKDRISKNTLTLDNIILGNGSNELIDIAVRTYMDNEDEAIMAIPSFIVYSMAVRSVGGKAIEVPLKSFKHDLDKIADLITEKTKIVFIANPNNPTGTINRKDEFEKFMEKVPTNVLVVIDEAYREYVSDTDYPNTLKYLNSKKNIIILRTFSKIYGLAGLRIGYGLSSIEIIKEMNKIREPFNTNTLAQLAALYSLEDDEHVKRSIELNEEGKIFLYKELERLGLRYVPTEANFIYIILDQDANSLYEALLKKGVIIRPVGQREIRVTIGMPEENKRFIEALKTVMRNP